VQLQELVVDQVLLMHQEVMDQQDLQTQVVVVEVLNTLVIQVVMVDQVLLLYDTNIKLVN
jgi:hypothetical protein